MEKKKEKHKLLFANAMLDLVGLGVGQIECLLWLCKNKRPYKALLNSLKIWRGMIAFVSRSPFPVSGGVIHLCRAYVRCMNPQQ